MSKTLSLSRVLAVALATCVGLPFAACADTEPDSHVQVSDKGQGQESVKAAAELKGG